MRIPSVAMSVLKLTILLVSVAGGLFILFQEIIALLGMYEEPGIKIRIAGEVAFILYQIFLYVPFKKIRVPVTVLGFGIILFSLVPLLFIGAYFIYYDIAKCVLIFATMSIVMGFIYSYQPGSLK